MGKKPEEKEPTEPITIRIEVTLSHEFDVLKEAIPFSKKATIMKECLEIGLNEFKKQRPDVMRMVNEYYKTRPEKKRTAA